MKYFLTLTFLFLFLLCTSCTSTSEKEESSETTGSDQWSETDPSSAPDSNSGESVITNDDPYSSQESSIDELFQGENSTAPGWVQTPPKGYRLYSNSAYHYSAIIPSTWYINETKSGKTGITKVTQGSAAITTYSDYPAKGNEIYYSEKAKKYAYKNDPSGKIIIENKEVALDSDTIGLLNVVEYTRKGTKTLSRSLIIVKNGAAHIVICESPSGSFYKNEEHFNLFMTSFKAKNSNADM